MCSLVRERKCVPFYLFLLPISDTTLYCTEEAKYWSTLTVKGILSINNWIQFSRRAKAGTFPPTIAMVSCSVRFNCYCTWDITKPWLGRQRFGVWNKFKTKEKKKRRERKEAVLLFWLLIVYTVLVHLFLIPSEPIDLSDPYSSGAWLPNQVYSICKYRKLYWGKRSC